MARKRLTNKHLPPHVYHQHGAFYFRDKKRKWHRLGATLIEAMANYAKIVETIINITTMNELFTRYMQEVAPTKSPATYKKNIYEVQHLIKVFGDMLPHEITPVDIYKYLDIRGKTAPMSANREKSLLSHIFSMAIRWGVMRDNPCRLVKRITERPRDRYIEDWEYHAVRNVAPLQIQLLMDFAYLSGQRIGDILKIILNDITEEGIYIKQNKTKVKLIIIWSDALRECVDDIRKKLPRSNVISFTLFCNNKGAPLEYEAFSSAWLKVMKKALAEGELQERFRFHDIRAKSASDITNRVDASALLGHANVAMTERVYNRKASKVKPTL